jgi:predicted ribosome quality control (RQC) complex YloA/Tae2 family protein
MLEEFYESKESAGRVSQKKSALEQPLKAREDKLLLKKQRLLEDIQKAERADEYRHKGDLLTANLHMLSKGMKEAKAVDWERQDAATGEAPTVKIALDEKLSPAANAQRYYKKYSKAKTSLVEKQKQLEIAEEEIDFVQTQQTYIENAASAEDLDYIREELEALGYVRRRRPGGGGKCGGKSGKNGRKAGAMREPLSYTTSHGHTLFVGRNSRENDELTLKRARGSDWWLHTKDIPGSHVILAADADEESIREAAQVAAYYSKARDSEGVPVDYCLCKYVKKPSGAKPGMVIFTHNKTLYVKPRLP